MEHWYGVSETIKGVSDGALIGLLVTWTVSWQTFDIFCSFLQSSRYQVLGFVVCEIHI